MRPIAGTKVYGVHKDLLFPEQIDNPTEVSEAYEFVWGQGAMFLRMNPELSYRIVDQTVVDVVVERDDGKLIQRIEWQCQVREG